MEWRPIETAPKDGSIIKLCWLEGMDGPFDVVEMRWSDTEQNLMVGDVIGMWVHEGSGITWCDEYGAGPTHWMPLSQPPEITA